MIGKRLESITASDLQSLVDNAVRESRTIEYKRQFPATWNNDERKEFLQDVSSFANTAGGDILYGIDAPSSIPQGIPGITIADQEALRLKLEGMLRDGLDPRIPGVQFRDIPLSNGNFVFLIRVPQSWSSPHRVSHSQSSKFFGRTSTGKFLMDTAQLRSAFLQKNELPQRIRAWCDERLTKIQTGNAPTRLSTSDIAVLHLVPLAAFQESTFLSAKTLEAQWTKFSPVQGGSRGYRLNFDGLLVHCPTADPSTSIAYTQAFRSGIIEFAYSGLIYLNQRGDRVVRSKSFEQDILEATGSYLKALSSIEIVPPLVVSTAVLGVQQAYVNVGSHGSSQRPHPIDRPRLILPDILIEEPPTDLPRIFRAAFDTVWNAGGIAASPNFDAQGNWAGGELGPDVPQVNRGAGTNRL